METQLTEKNEITAAHPFPEGKIANAIESKTAHLPSELFLIAAGGSIATALALKISGRDKDALFVGQWAAPFLLLGIYNKMVKMFGTDPHQKP